MSFLKEFWHAMMGYRSFRVVYRNGTKSGLRDHFGCAVLKDRHGGKIVFDPPVEAEFKMIS